MQRIGPGLQAQGARARKPGALPTFRLAGEPGEPARRGRTGRGAARRPRRAPHRFRKARQSGVFARPLRAVRREAAVAFDFEGGCGQQGAVLGGGVRGGVAHKGDGVAPALGARAYPRGAPGGELGAAPGRTVAGARPIRSRARSFLLGDAERGPAIRVAGAILLDEVRARVRRRPDRRPHHQRGGGRHAHHPHCEVHERLPVRRHGRRARRVHPPFSKTGAA